MWDKWQWVFYNLGFLAIVQLVCQYGPFHIANMANDNQLSEYMKFMCAWEIFAMGL